MAWDFSSIHVKASVDRSRSPIHALPATIAIASGASEVPVTLTGNADLQAAATDRKPEHSKNRSSAQTSPENILFFHLTSSRVALRLRGNLSGGAMVSRCALILVTLMSAVNVRAAEPQSPLSNNSKAFGLITGLPYTAQQLITTTVVHPDGSKTITVQQAELARNSAGSTCYVVHAAVRSSGSVVPASSSVVSTLIHDAKVQQAIHLNPASKTALVTTLPSITGIPKTSQVTLFRSGFSKPNAPQSLGTNTLIGLVVNGTRVVRTSLSGASSTSMTTDTWFSSEMNVVVESDTQDSSGSSRKVALASLIPGEPDPSLFVIPSGYTVTK